MIDVAACSILPFGTQNYKKNTPIVPFVDKLLYLCIVLSTTSL